MLIILKLYHRTTSVNPFNQKNCSLWKAYRRVVCIPNISSSFRDVNSTWLLHDRIHQYSKHTSNTLLLWFVALSRQREVSPGNSVIPPATLYRWLRNSNVVLLKWKTLLLWNNHMMFDHALGASDVLLSSLHSHHVDVDYWSYHTLAEGRPSITCTHFPFNIVAFRY